MTYHKFSALFSAYKENFNLEKDGKYVIHKEEKEEAEPEIVYF